MFAKVQKFFAKKAFAKVCSPFYTIVFAVLIASLKAFPTPPMMSRRDSDDKTLVNAESIYTPSPKSSTSTLVDPPTLSTSNFDFIQMVERSTTHDRWLVSDIDTSKHYSLRSTINSACNTEDYQKAKVEAQVYEEVKGDEHFLQMVEMWEEGACAYQATEYFPFSLEDVKEELPLNAGRTQLYAAHMVHALATLHEKGIAHNDVKLANVFLNITGLPVLGGMGKSQVLKTTLMCEEDFVDFRANPDADGGCFLFKREVNKKDFVEYIRGLGRAMYEMQTSRALTFDQEGNTKIRLGEHVPPTLRDLLKRIFGERTSPLKDDISYIQSHPYFANIDWNEIAFPQTIAEDSDSETIDCSSEPLAATYHHTPIEFPKPEVASDALLYADISEIECDWEVTYGKPRPPTPLPVERDIMDLELHELVGRYAPLKGGLTFEVGEAGGDDVGSGGGKEECFLAALASATVGTLLEDPGDAPLGGSEGACDGDVTKHRNGGGTIGGGEIPLDSVGVGEYPD
ncbi:hypothetical protein ONZ45_g10673 [Pleurotus djamor]|nr:hypothetical protein ONZ45_g10673 [Pleurotus djamor]